MDALRCRSMDAATDDASRGRAPRAVSDPVAASRPGTGAVSTSLVALVSLVFFLVLQHGHFKGTDEIAMFEMTRSLYERGDLAVPPIRHTEVGADGRRYSYFMPGQAVLALPLYALAGPLRAVLPDAATTALAGPSVRQGAHVYGGELEVTLVGLLAPITAAALVALFFRFQLELGVRARTAAVLSLLLAATTHTAVMSAYLLRHTTESFVLLGALFLFGRFARGAPLGTLALGSALASMTFLFRVPASVSAPVLAAYLFWALRERGVFSGGVRAAAPAFAVVLAPLLAAVAIYGAINHAKWGSFFASPMVAQQGRFDSPLWRGAAGLLLSPGSSIFVYSPLLVVAPAGLAALWRSHRAEALALVGMFFTLVVFYARFDGWSGLWSAPGPRYLYPLVPLLLLPVGLWLDRIDTAATAWRAWTLVAGLAALGAWVQLVSLLVRWGLVPTLAGYPVLGPDQSDFLFDLARSPVVVMSDLLLGGGPRDSWLLALFNGWPGFPGRPGAVILLLGLWALLLVAGSVLLARSVSTAAPSQREAA
jgi:hypothetical protein